MARTKMPVFDPKNPEPRVMAEAKARKEAKLRDERLQKRREEKARENPESVENIKSVPGHRRFSVESVSKKVRNWLKTLGNTWHKTKPTPPTSQTSSNHEDSAISSNEQMQDSQNLNDYGDSAKSSDEQMHDPQNLDDRADSAKPSNGQSHEVAERPWESREDHAIITGRDDGESYHRINKDLDGRTTPECILRHHYLLNNKKGWTEEETEQLFAHVQAYSSIGYRLGDAKIWKMIATEFECRSGADCWQHLRHQQIQGLDENHYPTPTHTEPKFSEAGDLEPESSRARSSEAGTSEPTHTEPKFSEAGDLEPKSSRARSSELRTSEPNSSEAMSWEPLGIRVTKGLADFPYKIVSRFP
ncbi:hypothetical protein N7G274_006639 [Stereocaulon virgatum]|uniref:Myb-like domain-containing protein n=1 Tax=Stereocaulon virgatum TaxID=373712 RepID=A0ABR4A5F3_9LECA